VMAELQVGMLRQPLIQAARKHVDGQGYATLMTGAIESLLVVLDTPQLAEVFPTLGDRARVRSFTDFLTRQRAELSRPGKRLNYLDTLSLIEQIFGVNSSTVDLPQNMLVFEMSEGFTGVLDDFTSMIWPADVPALYRSTQGTFKGVGIQISRRDNRLVVVSPLENTPAQRAGIRAGDIIALVDGQNTDSWNLNRAVDAITGPVGTEVTLSIERKGEDELIDFTIRRAEIVIESIRGWQHAESGGWDYLIDPEHRVVYVRLSQFIPQSVETLDRVIAELDGDEPIGGVILDLRFNPGGLLTSAVDIPARFVGAGPIVATVGGNRKEKHRNNAKRRNTYRHFPVVVLINGGSASASEIVAGALQDYGRGVIVGTNSFGKGSVQDLIPVSNGSAFLKLTTHYYMLPKGRIIHRKPMATSWGIQPDIEVSMTDQQVIDALELRQQVDVIHDADEALEEQPPVAADILEGGSDPQLETALLVLKAQLVADDIAMAKADR